MLGYAITAALLAVLLLTLRRLRAAEAALAAERARRVSAERALAQTQSAHAWAAERAERDALTGLANRRAFERALASLAARSAAAALVMLDIDHFKSLNDTEGHEAGDAALAALAGVLRSCTRPSDLPFRYGGEEFGVLLPGLGVEAASQVAERIRAAAEASLPRTVSAGVACAPPAAYERLVAEADAALYRAKRTGRNRVELCREDDLVEPKSL